MKKLTLISTIIFVLSLSLPVSGQTNADSTTTKKYVYCEIVGNQKLLSTKVTVAVDYGEETTYWKDTRLRDEQTGKVQSFNSMVDALNFMGNDGWEFVQAYTITVGNSNVYHWLLKKEKAKLNGNNLEKEN